MNNWALMFQTGGVLGRAAAGMAIRGKLQTGCQTVCTGSWDSYISWATESYGDSFACSELRVLLPDCTVESLDFTVGETRQIWPGGENVTCLSLNGELLNDCEDFRQLAISALHVFMCNGQYSVCSGESVLTRAIGLHYHVLCCETSRDGDIPGVE